MYFWVIRVFVCVIRVFVCVILVYPFSVLVLGVVGFVSDGMWVFKEAWGGTTGRYR